MNWKCFEGSSYIHKRKPPRAQAHMEIGFYRLKMLLLTSVLAAELVSAFKAHLKRWAVIARSTWEIKPSESEGRLIPVMLTTLELICTIFTILLPITKPHAGDAVPAGAGEVAFSTFLPVGDCGSQRKKRCLIVESINKFKICLVQWEFGPVVVWVIIPSLKSLPGRCNFYVMQFSMEL